MKRILFFLLFLSFLSLVSAELECLDVGFELCGDTEICGPTSGWCWNFLNQPFISCSPDNKCCLDQGFVMNVEDDVCCPPEYPVYDSSDGLCHYSFDIIDADGSWCLNPGDARGDIGYYQYLPCPDPCPLADPSSYRVYNYLDCPASSHCGFLSSENAQCISDSGSGEIVDSGSFQVFGFFDLIWNWIKALFGFAGEGSLASRTGFRGGVV